MNRNSRTIENCSADVADVLLLECRRSLGCLDRLEDVMRLVQIDQGVRSFPHFVKLEAVAHAGKKAVRGKLRDGVIILDPEFLRALLTKVDALSSKAKSDSSPAERPVAASVVAGEPDRAVVAREPQAVLTPSATPFSSPSASSNPE